MPTRRVVDANGNRSSRTVGGHSDLYSYDDENRLIEVDYETGGAGTGAYGYGYDYRTRRVQRSEPGAGATRVVFDGGVSILEYTSSAGSPQVEYVRGHDYGGGVGGLEYSVRAGAAKFNGYDSRGDVTTQTDAGGAVTFQTAYEAFGTQTVTSGATADRQKASTKEQDPTGLLNEGFRYRDPQTGTFLSRDPLGFQAGPNMYTYVRQNPWTHFDPEGLDTEKQYQEHQHQEQQAENQALKNYWKNTPIAKRTQKDQDKIRKPYEEAIAKDQKHIDAIEATAKSINDAAQREVVKASSLDDASPFYRGLQKIQTELQIFYLVQGTGLVIAESALAEAGGTALQAVVNAVKAGLAGRRVLSAAELAGKTRTEIRQVAGSKGYKATGDKTNPDFPRKWKDSSGQERIRLDRGHIDPKTGKPYKNPKAAGDHVHGYNADGSKILHNGDPHIPTTGE